MRKNEMSGGRRERPHHIALFRGINVGTAKRAPMAELREVFEGLGYHDVTTVLNSGNVVFSGLKPSEVKIEAAFAERFGFASRVTLVGAGELAEIVEENPIAEIPDASRFLVAFLKNAAQREELLPLSRMVWDPEKLAVGKRVAYLWCPEGVLASRVNQAVGKALKDSVTVRNWATVLKLVRTPDASLTA